MTAQSEPPLSTAEVARMFSVTPVTISRWVRSGRLRTAGKMPGTTGAYVFDRAEIERLAGASC
ncbi:helix-turn-helix domain-containing protein [Gordonia neofelifaecis]|uniref:helix-turn-helix domain-containing protein n=1 Tax=Gordonia neofelifaecis TaxID=945692 RepID=UPI0009FF5F07